MKKLLFLFVGLLLMVISAESVKAQTATATASATIVEPISIAVAGELNFGAIVPSTTLAGSVVVASDGTPTPTNVTLISLVSASVPTFTVTGAPNATFYVTLPISTTISNGTESMTVSSFTQSVANPLTLGATTGTEDFSVGATLTVAADQAVGAYTGSFDVTVAYN